MYIEGLDYGVTIDSKETVNYFRNFPDRGSIGYFSYEDAEADRNPLGNVEKYLDIVEDFISAGLIGDHYVFTDGQVSEIISEYEEWDWTPETGIVPWESETEFEPEVCRNRKQRRAIRINYNKSHKGSDRAHGKRRPDSAKNLRRWENDEAQMERVQVMWHENNKGEYVPRPVNRGYHERRYFRTTDTNRIPVYYVDTANHLDMEYKERKRTIKRGCVVYDYVPAIVTPEAVQGESV